MEIRPQPDPAYDLDDSTQLLDRPEMLPPQIERVRQSSEEVFWTDSGKAQISVTTDAVFYGRHPESREFWTSGNPVFPEADAGHAGEIAPTTLRKLLDGQFFCREFLLPRRSSAADAVDWLRR